MKPQIVASLIACLGIGAPILAVTGVGVEKQLPRLAVINDPETGALADQIVAALSKRSDVVLLEREQIGRALREQQSQLAGFGLQESLRIGKLMKADGLLVIAARPDEKLTVARLVAVDPGVVLWSWRIPQVVNDATKAVGLIEQRIGVLLPKLTVSRQAAVPVSVLNLRCEAASADAARLERELTELLIDRLARQPAVFVLERQKMATLQWEKEFISATTNEFWTGRFVVDGTISRQGSKLVVQARLLPPAGKQGAALSVTEDSVNVLALVDRLAQQVLQFVGKGGAPADWQPVQEAKLFAEEAEWAMRSGIYPGAQAASEAAWALGQRSRQTCLVWLQSYLVPAEQAAQTLPVYRSAEMTVSSAVRQAQRGLEVYLESLATLPQRGEKVDAAWIGCGADVLLATADVLKMAYETDPSKTGVDGTAELQELRSLARELAARLAEATAQHPETKKPRRGPHYYPWKRDRSFVGEEMCTIHSVRVWCGGLWHEKPEPVFQEFRGLFFNREDRPAVLRVYLIRSFIRPEIFRPVVVDWEQRDGKRIDALWAGLIQELCGSTNSELRVVGRAMRLARLVPGLQRPRRVKETSEAITDLLSELWQARSAVVKGDIAARTFADIVSRIEDVANYPNAGIDQGPLISFRKKFFALLMEQSSRPDEFLDGAVSSTDDYSPDEARVTAELIRQFRKRIGDEDDDSRYGVGQRELEKMAARTPPKPDGMWSPPCPCVLGTNNCVAVHKFWLAPGQNIGGVLWKDDRLWVSSSTIYSTRQISSLNLDTMQAEHWPFAETNWWNMSFAEIDGKVFISTQGKVWRNRTPKGPWEVVTLPDGAAGPIWAAGTNLYLCPPGMIYELNPGTSECRLLASSRRKPPLTALDDCAPYTVENVFLGKQDQLCVALSDSRIFARSPDTNRWTYVFPARPADISKSSEYELLLRAIGNRSDTVGTVRRDYMAGSIVQYLAEQTYGRRYDFNAVWPPKVVISPERQYTCPPKSAAAGEDGLWITTSLMGEDSLLFSSRSFPQGGWIPLEFRVTNPNVKTCFVYGKLSPNLCVTPKGLVLYHTESNYMSHNGCGVWFVPTEELHAYIAESFKEQAKQ